MNPHTQHSHELTCIAAQTQESVRLLKYEDDSEQHECSSFVQSMENPIYTPPPPPPPFSFAGVLSAMERSRLMGAWSDRNTNDIFAHCSLIFYYLDFKFSNFVCPSELHPLIWFF